MSNWHLFAISTAIWGSTWLVITFQLGVVAPEVSVAYRFALASAMVFAWCRVRRVPLRYPLREHLWFSGLGVCAFGLNYVLVYRAESLVTSGLVAMVFALIVFLNPALARVAFGTPVTVRLAAGATLGVVGTALLFRREAGGASPATLGVVLSVASMLVAVLGNLIAQRNERAGVPTLAGLAWGMLYGAAAVAAWALATGVPWRIELTAAYLASLVYLALFGSVIAFAAYFTLLGRVGPGPSAYVAVVCPVIALVLSAAFEGYRWSVEGATGVVLIVAGMVLSMAGAGRAGRGWRGWLRPRRG